MKKDNSNTVGHHVRIRKMNLKETVICEQILRDLPQWFGIESAIVEYAGDIKKMDTYLAELESDIAGFITLKYPDNVSAEIQVMAVKQAFHKQGVGKKLLAFTGRKLEATGVTTLFVKTLGPSHPDRHYFSTRAFYLSVGFAPVKEDYGVWGKETPCLIMEKTLKEKTK